MRISTIRNPWVSAVTAFVLVFYGVAAAIWIVRNTTDAAAPPDDCAIVEQLAREWSVRAAATNVAADSDERDPSYVFDRWSVMSDKARAGADSVSTPALKQDLNKWAEGFALFAQLQRDATGQPAHESGKPGRQPDLDQAGDLIYNTAADLQEACPKGWPEDSDSGLPTVAANR